MKTTSLLLLAAALAAATSAPAATSQVSPTGFLVTHKVIVKTRPPQAWNSLGLVTAWWDPRHTYSGDAQRLRLEMRAGGCFCETWEEGSVEHARVVYTAQHKTLRLLGALGPLQDLGVNGVLQFSLEPAGDDTAITLTYRVRGAADAGLEKAAAPVDRVLGEQLERFARYVFTGSVTPKAPEAPPEDRFFQSGGANVRYIEMGAGADTVVFVHDQGASIESQWLETGALKAFAKSHRVLALDVRGHGKTGGSAGDGTALAQDVVALLDHLKIPRAHIVGYGSGAAVAAYLAANQPRRVITTTLAAGARILPGAAQLAGLALTDEQVRAIKVPSFGIVGTLDPAMADLLALKRVMPFLVRMVTVDGENRATTPRHPQFATATLYFLSYHPGSLVK